MITRSTGQSVAELLSQQIWSHLGARRDGFYTVGSMWWVSNDDHGAYAARGVHGQILWIDPTADRVIARFASNPVAANAASDPTSLPAYRAVANHLMANDKSPLLGPEWFIESILDQVVIDSSHATLQFFSDGSLAGNATCNRLVGTYDSKGTALRMEPGGTTKTACPAALMNQERKLLERLPAIDRFRIDGSGALILLSAGKMSVVARRETKGQ